MLLQLNTLLQLHCYMFAIPAATDLGSTARFNATCLQYLLLQILVALLGSLLHVLLHIFVELLSWVLLQTFASIVFLFGLIIGFATFIHYYHIVFTSLIHSSCIFIHKLIIIWGK